jgi:hypothetical protein
MTQGLGDKPDLRGGLPAANTRSRRSIRRLSGVDPVYAAPDQDVCGVYMSSRSVRHETTDL